MLAVRAACEPLNLLPWGFDHTAGGSRLENIPQARATVGYFRRICSARLCFELDL